MGIWIVGDKKAFRIVFIFCLIMEENIETFLILLSQIISRILNPVSVFFS